MNREPWADGPEEHNPVPGIGPRRPQEDDPRYWWKEEYEEDFPPILVE